MKRTSRLFRYRKPIRCYNNQLALNLIIKIPMSAVNQCYVLTHKTGYGSVWHAYRWLYANRRVPGSVLGCGKWCFVRVFDHFRPLLVAVIYWFESKMCEDAVLLFVRDWLVSFRSMVCCFAECVQEEKDRVCYVL